MSDDFSSIRPREVPLSHAGAAGQREPPTRGNQLTWLLAGLLSIGLLVIVFFVLPQWLESPARDAQAPLPGARSQTSTGTALPQTAETQPKPTAAEDEQLPPYQTLLREQARNEAQAELAKFVELQMKLQSEMTVGAWGSEAYDQAKDLAAAGDEAFVREEFAESLQQYRSATQALAALIDRGNSLLEQALTEGEAALAARNQEAASSAFDLAGTIAPDDPRVAAGKERTSALPTVGDMMREARNLELAEEWDAALALYQEVQSLDPQTAGLKDAMDRANAGAREARIQRLLSSGFASLDAGAFAEARKAFRAVLSAAPGHPVATGALEQVSKNAALARLNDLKTRAEAAAAAERWSEAESLYGEVLATDPTIQFAISGRSQAREQRRLGTALGRIIQSPDRLSSEKLYREAQGLLEQAEQLEPRGPVLGEQIVNLREILLTYANPVTVTFKSDALTQVTLSTVGELGRFSEKQLQLRPGAYTLVGSRDGCRDVREQILVRPNMPPVDIRCIETL